MGKPLAEGRSHLQQILHKRFRRLLPISFRHNEKKIKEKVKNRDNIFKVLSPAHVWAQLPLQCLLIHFLG